MHSPLELSQAARRLGLGADDVCIGRWFLGKLYFPYDGTEEIRVLPLDRIYLSKKAWARDKDMAHLPLLANVIKAQKMNDGKKKQ